MYIPFKSLGDNPTGVQCQQCQVRSIGIPWALIGGRFSILFIMLSSIRLSLLVWFWFMSHVSDPYVIIGITIMHDSIRVQMVSMHLYALV